jgi:predicted transglutaminase-like cysteine proteinase
MRLACVVVLAAIAVMMVAPSTVSADPVNLRRVQEKSSARFMRVFGVTEAPHGHVEFCARMPEECKQGPPETKRFWATPARLSELDTVNRTVNADIEPATDMEVYGREEYWTIPATRGDCEDYALLKRKRLMARGWPASSLLITVVLDEGGAGHAVLTARTAQGDFILDNKVDEIKLWNYTGYQFIMRQSFVDPVVWMSLDPNVVSSRLSIARVRSQRQGSPFDPHLPLAND